MIKLVRTPRWATDSLEDEKSRRMFFLRCQLSSYAWEYFCEKCLWYKDNEDEIFIQLAMDEVMGLR